MTAGRQTESYINFYNSTSFLFFTPVCVSCLLSSFPRIFVFYFFSKLLFFLILFLLPSSSSCCVLIFFFSFLSPRLPLVTKSSVTFNSHFSRFNERKSDEGNLVGICGRTILRRLLRSEVVIKFYFQYREFFPSPTHPSH